MEYYGYVYKITNLINGIIYIGQKKGKIEKTKNYYGSGNIISKALRKYGKEKFYKGIICLCKSKEDLNEKEIYYISYYRSLGIKLYNITDGGLGGKGLSGKLNGMYGRKHSEERLKKMSEMNKGKNNFWYGKTGKLSSAYGKPGTMLGKHHSEESKEKTRNALKNRIFTKEHIEKLKIAAKRIDNSGKLNPKSKSVLQIDKTTNKIIKKWDCIREVERELKILHSGISRCCNPKYGHKSCGGFKWKYA